MRNDSYMYFLLSILRKKWIKKPHIPFLLNLVGLVTKTWCFNCVSTFDEESIIFLKCR